MTLSETTKGFARSQGGVAAIEMAIIFPVMLLMLFGMIELTGMLGDDRRIEYSASVVADTLTRSDDGTLTPAEIDDSFQAVQIIMDAARASNLRIEVHNYRIDTTVMPNVVTKRWTRQTAGGINCDDPSTTGLAALMTEGNDYLIAVVCAQHEPLVTNIIAERFRGTAKLTLRHQLAMRPRQSLTLLCPLC